MKIIRDPLWNNIRVDPLALQLIDTPAFQRLRYVRQLGLAFLVYPGATHSRFEHALGTYHLARRTLALLDERGGLERIGDEECNIVRAAALLHDIGHYPFSHALEEIGALHHEAVAEPLIIDGPIADLLRTQLGEDAPDRVVSLIKGESRSPLQGLISGSIDLDKLDYLRRDAFMCGVSYGEIDVDRLINSLTVVDPPDIRHPTPDHRSPPSIGISEKGLSALESLLFARYQMYRNVYWHHAVRSATAMYKRLVSEALHAGSLDAPTLAGFTDEGLIHALAQRAPSALLARLQERRLFKRVFECPAADLDPGAGEWIAEDRALTALVEDRLGGEFGLDRGELLLDYPAKTQMLDLDLAVVRGSGEVRRLTSEGWQGSINLPRLADELYRSARWLRVFAARRVSVDRERILEVVNSSPTEIRNTL